MRNLIANFLDNGNGQYSQEELDNHSTQLNPEHENYWKSRED